MVTVSAETVEKPFGVVNGCFLWVSMTPRNCEIVDCSAFCEVIFSASPPRICLGTSSTVSL